MEGLDEFEQAVLEKLLAGDHPVLVLLRAQAQAARITSREHTGAGFFLSFELPAGVPLLALRDLHFGDLNAVVSGLEHGAGFVIFVREGRIAMLEGYSYGEPWPEEIDRFELTYQSEPRELGFLDR